jgi:hypothetical protein
MLTEDQVNGIVNILLSQTKQLARVADALEIVARNTAPEAPNYQRPIGEYTGFDWDSIGAEVIGSDDDGPTVVSWGDFTWQRRAPQNKFAEAIWFSRPIGKNADGQVRYARLISFKTTGEADPLPPSWRKAIETAAVVESPAPQPHTAPRAAPAVSAQSFPSPVPQDAPKPAQDTPRPTPKPPAQANGKPAPAPRYDPLKDERLKGLKKPSLALDLPGVVASTTLYYHLVKLFACDAAKAAQVWAEAQHGDSAQAIHRAILALDDVILPF